MNRANGKEIFQTFRSEGKKRTTPGGDPQFPNGFFGKLLFHLTFNRNFRIFLFRFLRNETVLFWIRCELFAQWGLLSNQENARNQNVNTLY